jgi:dimethylhistidine N-methyltransferase
MNIHTSRAALLRSLDPSRAGFAADVLAGFSAPRKHLSPKYFYDAAGSDLFEAITRLPEYYPTRTELQILRRFGRDIAAALPGRAALVEFGAGATTKIRLLLQSGLAGQLGAYVPVDISGDFVTAQAAALQRDFPALPVHPVVADFTRPFALPEAIAGLPRAGFFPGSTLGNFEPAEAAAFLRGARELLGSGATLVIGIDLEKDIAVLERAYDDAAGVTARFNLNLLVRINRELGADFDLGAFRHRAVYNTAEHRIEMHLVSAADQSVDLLGTRIAFRAGETIHTENSYKYSAARFAALASEAGWEVAQTWMDDEQLFAVHALRA